MNKLQKEIISKISDIADKRGITIISPYVDLKTKITIMDNKTNEKWDVLPNTILNGKIMSPSERSKMHATLIDKSVTTRKLTSLSDFLEKIKSNKYVMYYSGYKNLETKCCFKCNLCGEIFETTPKSILRGFKHKKCGNITPSRKLTTEQFKKKIEDITNGEYTVLSDYVDKYTKVKIRHNKCGREYYVTPKYFIRGDRCSKCKDKIHDKSFKTFTAFLEKYAPQYEIASAWNGRKSKVILKNKTTGKTFETYPDRFINGTREYGKAASCGEKLISKILRLNKVKYTLHYKESKLVDKRPLEFDFKIGNTFIEYNGIQHYQDIWSEKKLKYTKKHDKMKQDYCKTNNISLLIIKYTDDDIEIQEKVLNFLKENNLL